MTSDKAHRRVLLIGKSQLVLDESVAGLRDLGYKAEATNDFTDITGRFDVKEIDLVVFGGQVPPGRKAELREEFGAINPGVIFVQGLAGIPGLLHWQAELIEARCGAYLALELGGGLGGGIVECGTRRPLWLPYVEVDRVDEATERARQLGAQVLLEPREGPVGWRSVVSAPSAGEIAFWQPK
jgi:predicted enzyme related to lactoylglutathione lyase